MEPESALQPVFEKHLEHWRLVSMETVTAGVMQEVVYSVTLRSSASPSELLDAVRAVNGNQKVALVMGQHEVDL